MNILEVKFDNEARTSYYRNKFDNIRVKYNVIVDSDRGSRFGQVVSIIDDISKFDNVDLYEVIKSANKKDYHNHLDNVKEEERAIEKCNEFIKKFELSMNILDASFNFDRSQLLFRFVAEERVDFRQLAKELGSVFKTRIELRQVGIRDKAKEVGGIGPCGRLLCCSSFLNSFDSVTISMAKNQNVSLNPSKINGVCGRLLCCLKYENDNYSELKKDLPKVGKHIKYNGRDVKVLMVNILEKKIKLELEDKSVIEVDSDDCKK